MAVSDENVVSTKVYGPSGESATKCTIILSLTQLPLLGMEDMNTCKVPSSSYMGAMQQFHQPSSASRMYFPGTSDLQKDDSCILRSLLHEKLNRSIRIIIENLLMVEIIEMNVISQENLWYKYPILFSEHTAQIDPVLAQI